jgi:FAD:protein FMN transferase
MMPASADVRRAQPLLGTFVEITAGGCPRAPLDAAIEGAFRVVAEVHRLMSPREPDSDVSRLNREAGTDAVTVHPWTYEVLGMARDLHLATAGIFDVAVAPTSRAGNPLPHPRIELQGGGRVRFLHADLRIDLGGLAKGFAVDRAVASLRASAVPRGLVNAGGDMAAFGPGPSAVSIRDPRRPQSVLCQLEITDEALASSGGRIDLFDSPKVMESAVIDPRTCAPACGVLGATVRASTCMVADALTKVVMIAGEPAAALLALYGASGLFLSADGDLRATRDWSGGVRVAA